MLSLIDKTEDSIRNSLLDIKVYTTFTPSIVSAVTYNFYFNNSIKHPFSSSVILDSIGFAEKILDQNDNVAA